MHPCYFCGGTGNRSPLGMGLIRCDQCHGSGAIKRDLVTCPTCKGKRFAFPSASCGTCDSEGYVDRDKVK